MERETTPCGLRIKLEKDPLGIRRVSSDNVLGYYDRLSIQTVQKWLEFSPRNTAPQPKIPAESAAQPISAYPIKLLFPNAKTVQKLKELGLCYDVWQNSSPDDHFQLLFNEYPCITVILANLTDKFKGKLPRNICEDQIVRFAECVKAGADDPKVSYDAAALQAAHFCIMPSLGYSDYCILLAEQTWKCALPVMEYLHAATDDEGNPVLSTDYMMPAFHVVGGTALEPDVYPFWDEQCRLCVRVNLRPGVSMQQLKITAGGNTDVYQVSGAVDCLLVARNEEGVRNILHMLMPKEAGADCLGNMVLSTESTIRRLIEVESQKPSERTSIEIPHIMSDVFAELWEALSKYRNCLETGNRHMRQLSALYEQVTAIENICSEFHNESIQRVMAQWLPAFTGCLEKCVEKIDFYMHESYKGNDCKEILAELWHQTEEALGHFIQQVGSFVADLSRSDYYFMETEKCNHPSVSSATALLVAYNRWQNSFVEDVVKENIGSDGQPSSYPFLVRSGGCDSTHTTNLFYFLEPDTNNGTLMREELPLISQMSEMSLFDCGGAVFRMTHECMHFCGDRLRTERFTQIIAFVSKFYGEILTSAFLDPSAYLDRYITQLDEQFSLSDDNLTREMQGAWFKVYNTLKITISDKIKEELTSRFEKEKQSWTEKDYLSSESKAWIKEQLFDLFSGYEFDKDIRWKFSVFAEFLYVEQIRAVSILYAHYDVITQKHRDTLNIFALESRKVSQFFSTDENEPTNHRRTEDQSLRRWIILVLNQFLIDEEYHGKENNEPYQLRNENVDRVLDEVVFECFSEGFADLQACLRLDADMTDYLLSFVFEQWDPDVAFPLSASYICRVPAVLRVCFDDKLSKEKNELTDKAQSELKNAINQIQKHGNINHCIDCDALIKRVNNLLEQYCFCEDIAAELERYLNSCKDSYTEENPHTDMQRYSKAFKKIRLSAISTDSDSVTEMFQCLSMIEGD